MAKKKQPTKPSVRVSYKGCSWWSTEQMPCPMCGTTVPPQTIHECSGPVASDD